MTTGTFSTTSTVTDDIRTTPTACGTFTTFEAYATGNPEANGLGLLYTQTYYLGHNDGLYTLQFGDGGDSTYQQASLTIETHTGYVTQQQGFQLSALTYQSGQIYNPAPVQQVTGGASDTYLAPLTCSIESNPDRLGCSATSEDGTKVYSQFVVKNYQLYILDTSSPGEYDATLALAISVTGTG